MQSNELLDLLKSTGAIMDGHFLLTSGRHSNIYIEKFRILEEPFALDAVCKKMAEIVAKYEVDVVLGAAIGCILLSGGLGRFLGVKHIFSERVDGRMELRRGFEITKGQKIVIVEDIITTGGSVFELIELVEQYKAQVLHVVNLVDRTKDGIDFGVPATALLKIPSESWEVDLCPLCDSKISITERGRTGKKMETL